MPFQNKTLACGDCNKEFVFTAEEQEFYAQKGFQNEPKRCPDCRKARKSMGRGGGGGGGGYRGGYGGGGGGPRESYKFNCTACGKEDTVPFKPKNDRPLYCKDCFRNIRSER